MFTNQSTDLSLEAPCRALDSVRAERVDSFWMAATCALTNGASSTHNALSVLQFHSDVNELSIVASYEMDGPIRCVSCSPVDSSVVLTAPEQGPSATLWKIPQLSSLSTPSQDEDTDNQYEHERSYQNTRSLVDSYTTSNMNDTPEILTTLLPEGGFGANLVDLAWRSPSDDMDALSEGDVLTLDTNGHLTRWNVETSAATHVHSEDTAAGTSGSLYSIPPPRVAWDPHNPHAVAVTNVRCVSILDWRSSTSTHSADLVMPTGTSRIAGHAATRWGITDLDYNPNKPYILATSGLGGSIHIWDLRQTKQPVMTARGGHSHWVSSVMYNPSHDQLVLSTGTDGVANLWRLSTCSSAPLLQDTHVHHGSSDGAMAATSTSMGHHGESAAGTGHDGQSETAALNVRVARHSHGDSIYTASWGAADSWIYLTVSFDGKVLLHHVPSKEKYKILL